MIYDILAELECRNDDVVAVLAVAIKKNFEEAGV